jgi:hypothetical protein
MEEKKKWKQVYKVGGSKRCSNNKLKEVCKMKEKEESKLHERKEKKEKKEKPAKKKGKKKKKK